MIDDLDDDETKYVISAKTDSGLTIYSFPGLQKKIKDMTYDLIDAIEQKLIFKLGTTWVNTEHIVTVRVAKYIDEKEEEEEEEY